MWKKDFCNVILKILKYQNLINIKRAPFIIYADVKCIIEKIDGYKSNTEKTSTTKVRRLIPSGFSMSTISSFGSIENKYDVWRGKDCMKKFCEFSRNHAIKIFNLKKKKWVINKRAAGIIWKCKNLSYLERKNVKQIFERQKISSS